MNKKKLIIVIVLAVLIIVLAVSLTMCNYSKKGAIGYGDVGVEKEITFTNAEGKNQEELNSDEENFYGTWVGDSAHVEYLYGNLEITINEDGTATGNVTETDMKGTWEKEEDGVEFFIESEDGESMKGKLYFGEKCNLVIYEEAVDPIVIHKK